MTSKFAGSNQIPASDMFRAFTTVVESVSKWLEEERKTKVAVTTVNAQRDTAIAGIEAQRDFLLRSLDLVFDERRSAFEDLFARLDVALASQNQQAVTDVLSAITTLATKNPFSELKDHRIVIEQFRSDEAWEV